MVGPCPPTPLEKCRLCRLNYPCPVHLNVKKPDYRLLAKLKRWHATGKKRRKKRVKKGTKPEIFLKKWA
jgi:hypothetical protein